MVKFHQVNDWMKLLGNLGVFAGLMLVALQMQQANHIARSEQMAEATKAYMDLEIGMIGEHGASAWVKSVFDPASMTRDEIKVMDSYLINITNFLTRAQQREAAGLEAEGTFKNNVMNAQFFFGNSFAQSWWNYEREHHSSNPNLIQYMDEAIATMESNHTAKWMMRIERDIRNLPPVTEADLEKN